MTDQAKVIFYDGQRVRREDLEYLQENLLQSIQSLQSAVGRPGISWGFKTIGQDNSTIRVGEGLAFDAYGRAIIVSEPAVLPINLGENTLIVCVKYVSEVIAEQNGQSTRLGNNFQFAIFSESDVDFSQQVPVAKVMPRDGGYDVIQIGKWYIPPNNATHSGKFYEDQLGFWRYDGDTISSSLNPDFDSGWVSLAVNSDINIPHQLGSIDLLVQLQIKLGEGVISNQGIGADFYYELHDTSVIRLFNTTNQNIELNARLWQLDAEIVSQLNPVADAGLDFNAEHGESFNLDGSDSLAFKGRSVARYRWTLIE